MNNMNNMNNVNYIGPDDLLFNKNNTNGLHSCGFNVQSIMMRAGMSPIMTVNNEMSGGGSTNKVSDLFDSLVIPEWSDLFYLGYIPLNDDCSMWDYSFGIQGHNFICDKIFKPTNLWGLFAYGIKSELMKEMVNLYNQEFPMEIDRYFVNDIQKRGNSIAISPQLFCCDDNVHSDNLGFTPPNMTQKSIDSRFANPSDYI